MYQSLQLFSKLGPVPPPTAHSRCMGVDLSNSATVVDGEIGRDDVAAFDPYRHLNGHVVWKEIRDTKSLHPHVKLHVRVPPLSWHHSQALTLASRKGWKLGPGQKVAVSNLMVIGRARYPGHCADIIPIVTSHLHTAEAGKAA